MPCRQTIYANRERLKLVRQLGGVCVRCGDDDIDVLELDHINGRDWILKDFSSSARVARYKREAAAGELQVLCGDCNKRKYHEQRERTPDGKTADEVWNPEEVAA